MISLNQILNSKWEVEGTIDGTNEYDIGYEHINKSGEEDFSIIASGMQKEVAEHIVNLHNALNIVRWSHGSKE